MSKRYGITSKDMEEQTNEQKEKTEEQNQRVKTEVSPPLHFHFISRVRRSRTREIKRFKTSSLSVVA